jgi:hypothetical protein
MQNTSINSLETKDNIAVLFYIIKYSVHWEFRRRRVVLQCV